jgi:hypothetical protein
MEFKELIEKGAVLFLVDNQDRIKDKLAMKLGLKKPYLRNFIKLCEREGIKKDRILDNILLTRIAFILA